MDWLQSFRESGAAESEESDGGASWAIAGEQGRRSLPPPRPVGSGRAASARETESQDSDVAGERGGAASSRSDEVVPDVLASFRRSKQEYGPGLPYRARREAWEDDGEDGGKGGRREVALAAHSVSMSARSPKPPERPTTRAEHPRRITTSYRDRFPEIASTEGSSAAGGSGDDDEEPPKELYWSELSRKLQQDAQLLGWTEQTWDNGDVSPFATPWDDLTVRQKRAAGHLGFSVSEWDDGNDSALDKSNVSETWLEQSVSATDPAARQEVQHASPPRTRTPERARSHTTGSPIPIGSMIAKRPEVHPLVTVFEQLDTDGTGLIGRLAMLERLRSDRELRAQMQLSIHNLDDERAAFERVFHSMDTDPHYEVENLTLDEFLAYIRAHRHRAQDFTVTKKQAASAAESSTQYAESELEAVGQSTAHLDVKSGLDRTQRESRLAHAAVQAKTKVVIYVRLPSTSAVASNIAGARRQQRRGFVMVDTESGTLADVRQEIERQKIPVPRPFAFVLDLVHGHEQLIDMADEMQVLATELEPGGRAVVIHHKFSHFWYSPEPEPEPQLAPVPEPVTLAETKLEVAAAVAAREEEEAQAAEANAAIEEREAEAAKATADKELDDVRLARIALAEKQAEGDVEAIKLAEETLQREIEEAEEAVLVANQEQAEADEARMVAERERAEAEGATQVAVEAEREVARQAQLVGTMNSFDDFMATRLASAGSTAGNEQAIRREAAVAMERIKMQKEEEARLKAESWRMESIRREALKRGRHITAAKIQSAYRTRLQRRERHRIRRERVITILSLVRGYVYRRRFMRAKQASITIQALGRGICTRVKLAEQHQAATRLQAAHRGQSTRRAHPAGTVGATQLRSEWYQKDSPTRHGNSGRMHEIYSPDVRHNHHGESSAPVAGGDLMAPHLPTPAHMPEQATRDLRLELQSARLSALQQRALAAKITPEAVEDALDADNPKAAMIDLLLDWQEATAIAASAVQRQASRDSWRLPTGHIQHRVPMTAAEQVVEPYERTSSPVLNSFRAEQASRQQMSARRQRTANRPRTRREAAPRRGSAYRRSSRQHSSADWRDHDEWDSLPSDDASSGSMLSSDMSDDDAAEYEARGSRRHTGRPAIVAGRSKWTGPAEGDYTKEQRNQYDSYPADAQSRTRFLRSSDRRQPTHVGASTMERSRGGYTGQRRPRPASRQQDVMGQAARARRVEAVAAEAIQAGCRGFLLRSRLKHRVSLQLKRQIKDMEDLRATMIDEMETTQHRENESDRLLLTQVETQLERKKTDLAVQLSNPRAARTQIMESTTNVVSERGASPGHTSRPGPRNSASAAASVSTYRDKRARPLTPQERVEVAREKQRRLAAAAKRTTGASPLSGRRQHQHQRSPQRAQSHTAKRLGPSDDAWQQRSTGQTRVGKPHSFLIRGGGRSSNGAALSSPIRGSGSMAPERRKHEQVQRAAQPASGGQSPNLRVQEVVDDESRVADPQELRRQQHLKQRAEIEAATRRAQERLDYMQTELQALSGRDGQRQRQQQHRQVPSATARRDPSRESRPGHLHVDPSPSSGPAMSPRGQQHSRPHSDTTMLPPGVRPPQRSPVPGPREQRLPGGSPEAEFESPGGSQGRMSSTVSRLEAKNVQIERRMEQYAANSGGMRRGRRASGT